MNIVHLVSNKVWGGGERYALDLASASRDAGHDVSVFVKKNTPAAEIFASKGLLAGTMRLGGALDIFTPIRLAKRLDALAKPVSYMSITSATLRLPSMPAISVRNAKA